MARFIETIEDIVKSDSLLRALRIPRPAPTDTGIAHTPGEIVWGQVGDLPTPEIPPGVSFEIVDCDETHIETQRQTQDIRIENPDEPEDWVEVERPNKIFFNKTETKYGKPDNSAGVAPDFGDFSPSPIQFSSFKPLGTDSNNRCRLAVTLSNRQRAA